MPERFIINEWLWADLDGKNGKEKQKETIDFLKTLCKKCDKIVVAKGSKFQEKEREFSKKSIDVVRRNIIKFYLYNIKFNPQKYEEIDIHTEKKIDLNGINPDDHYLVYTYNKTKTLIITTDTKLLEVLKSKNIPCKLRDQFLREYFL